MVFQGVHRRDPTLVIAQPNTSHTTEGGWVELGGVKCGADLKSEAAVW
jgi:hypothetical protein